MTATTPLEGQLDRAHNPGLSALALKSTALVFMIAEHFALYFYDWLPSGTYTLLEYAGRFVGPVFLFLMVESMHYTRSRPKYLARLWSAAALMFVGNWAISAAVEPFSTAPQFFPAAHNIFLMLAVAASIVACVDAARSAIGWRRATFVLGALVLSGTMLFTEGGVQLLPALCIFYTLRTRRGLMLIAFSAYSVALGVYGWISNPEYFWTMENQWAQLLAVPLLAAYNGTPGRAGFKWLFYGIYPAHLWLFYVVSNLLPRAS